ncbi:MAG: hypothetical protein ACK42C_03445 [Aquificaceae bacterium]|jgi:hypothetical protein
MELGLKSTGKEKELYNNPYLSRHQISENLWHRGMDFTGINLHKGGFA